MKEIYLEKTNEAGNRQMYRYMIDGNTVTYEFGVIGGAIQSDTRVFSEGKNIGKANEKSPEQCCLEDTVTRARKKYEKGYDVIRGMDLIETNTSDAVKLADTGIPLPMLAQVMDKHMKKLEGKSTVYGQYKLDGHRCLINTRTGKMYSRSRKEIEHMSAIGLAVITACVKIANEIEWVDGELYSHDLTFNDLQTALRRWKNTDKEGTKELQQKIKFHIFDVISDNPWSKRMAILSQIEENDKVVKVPTWTFDPKDIAIEHQKCVDAGYEGLMIRFDDMPYEQKRSMSLFKYKAFEDAEFRVIGFESQDHDADKLGAVILEFPGTDETFNARPAMSDAMKDEIWNNKDRYLNRLATVKFQERDVKSGIPRFPVLTKFRLPEDMAS